MVLYLSKLISHLNDKLVFDCILLTDDDPNWTLKEHLIDELYYYLVPEEAWNKLVLWYGIVENQPPIARKVVEYGMYVKHCKVEVYLIEFKLCENSSMDNIVMRQFSKADTLGKY